MITSQKLTTLERKTMNQKDTPNEETRGKVNTQEHQIKMRELFHLNHCMH